jgi:hypothetical protein
MQITRYDSVGLLSSELFKLGAEGEAEELS